MRGCWVTFTNGSDSSTSDYSHTDSSFFNNLSIIPILLRRSLCCSINIIFSLTPFYSFLVNTCVLLCLALSLSLPLFFSLSLSCFLYLSIYLSIYLSTYLSFYLFHAVSHNLSLPLYSFYPRFSCPLPCHPLSSSYLPFSCPLLLYSLILFPSLFHLQGSEPMSDAVIFEPIPYRSALKENCTHIIAVRTRAGRILISYAEILEL